MSTVTNAHDAVNRMATWQAIDWVMKAISVAMHVAYTAGQTEIAADLGQVHERARQRRDRA